MRRSSFDLHRSCATQDWASRTTGFKRAPVRPSVHRAADEPRALQDAQVFGGGTRVVVGGWHTKYWNPLKAYFKRERVSGKKKRERVSGKKRCRWSVRGRRQRIDDQRCSVVECAQVRIWRGAL